MIHMTAAIPINNNLTAFFVFSGHLEHLNGVVDEYPKSHVEHRTPS